MHFTQLTHCARCATHIAFIIDGIEHLLRVKLADVLIQVILTPFVGIGICATLRCLYQYLRNTSVPVSVSTQHFGACISIYATLRCPYRYLRNTSMPVSVSAQHFGAGSISAQHFDAGIGICTKLRCRYLYLHNTSVPHRHYYAKCQLHAYSQPEHWTCSEQVGCR